MKDTSDYFFNIWGCATKLQGDLMFQSNWLPCLDMWKITFHVKVTHLRYFTVLFAEFDSWIWLLIHFLYVIFTCFIHHMIFYLTDSFFSTCENHVIINESCKNNHFSTWIIDFHMIFFSHTIYLFSHAIFTRFIHFQVIQVNSSDLSVNYHIYFSHDIICDFRA